MRTPRRDAGVDGGKEAEAARAHRGARGGAAPEEAVPMRGRDA